MMTVHQLMRVVMLGTVAAITVTLAAHSDACTVRSRTERARFMRTHPCPATGKPYGACPGFVVDHIKALCDGGPDKPSNMQWQDKLTSEQKDRSECKSAWAKDHGTYNGKDADR